MSDAGGRPTEPGGAGERPAILGAGATFAGLEIESEVGRGGMGVIYRARDPELDRARALKVLTDERSADPEFRERFRRESRQAAAIEHPNVIPVYRAGDEAGRLFLVMRLVDGPSLAEVIAERGRLPLSEVLGLVGQVAAGLDAAHAAGLIHRDVKPANVLLECNGPERRAFLCDFGISKLAGGGETLTSTGQFVGTVDYVAPEQLEGRSVDRRADVYSLACVGFHLLAGEPPFARETQLATMFAHANAPRPEAGEDIPSKVREVLKRGMAVDPADRPESAGEFAAELERAAGVASVARTERLTKPGRSRSRLLPFAAALAVLAAVAAGLVLFVGDGDDADPPARAAETRTMRVAKRPLGITVGPGRVWVASPRAKSVTAIRLDDREPQPTPIGEAPVAVAVGHDSVWVADRIRDEVLRIDPATGKLQDKVPVGEEPIDVAVGEDDVWVANSASANVTRIRAGEEGQRIDDTIPVGDRPSALAVDADGVWVVNRDERSISFIDPDVGHVTGKPIPVGQRPNDAALGAGSLWVTDNFNGDLIRIDLASREPADPIPVGSLPRSVAFGLGYLWVANGEDGTVTRIDPETAEVVGEPIEVGAQPASIAVGGGSIWTSDFGDSTVTEIRPAE